MKRNTMILVGIAAAAAYFYFRGRAPSGGGSGNFAPAALKPGETVTAGSYRVISNRRQGLQYVQAQGQAGGEISFKAPTGGRFTRNTVQEGGQLWAEVSPA